MDDTSRRNLMSGAAAAATVAVLGFGPVEVELMRASAAKPTGCVLICTEVEILKDLCRIADERIARMPVEALDPDRNPGRWLAEEPWPYPIDGDNV